MLHVLEAARARELQGTREQGIGHVLLSSMGLTEWRRESQQRHLSRGDAQILLEKAYCGFYRSNV